MATASKISSHRQQIDRSTDSLDPVSCFVGRLSILREGTADGEPAASAAFDNRPDSVVVVGRRDAYGDRGRLGVRVGAAVGGLGGNLVAQQFALQAAGCHGETEIRPSLMTA